MCLFESILNQISLKSVLTCSRVVHVAKNINWRCPPIDLWLLGRHLGPKVAPEWNSRGIWRYMMVFKGDFVIDCHYLMGVSYGGPDWPSMLN